MRRIALVGFLVASLAGLGSGCGGGGGGSMSGGSTNTPPPGCTATTAMATTSVSLSGTQFVPSCMKIAPGATITFQNADSMAHTVTTDPGQPETFDSGTIPPTQDFVHTFASAAETVHVHCTIHAGMTATIFVQ